MVLPSRGGRAAQVCALTAGCLLGLVAMPAAVAQSGGELPVETVLVDGGQQLGGPGYDIRAGVTEITNQQFADFLNDALADAQQANPTAKSHYLHFDTVSGAVYLSSDQTATVAPGSAGNATLLFDPAVAGQLTFDAVSSTYATATAESGLDSADHPVAGVSWFGALKYCDWLTLAVGLPLEERCYTEGPTLDDWHPVTVSKASWAVRDLLPEERQDLVESFLGYRLLMDGAAITRDEYNEWYYLAAFSEGDVDRAYAFGRDQITASDANYINSGDPFEVSMDSVPTTPVGLYDGASYATGELFADSIAFTTSENENFFGLSDLSGNVWEWVQGKFLSSALARRYRGGGFDTPASFLRTDTIPTEDFGDAVRAWVGFRVVQTEPHRPPVVLPETTTPAEAVIGFAGPQGGPYALEFGDAARLTIRSQSAVSFEVSISSNREWLLLNGSSDVVNVTLAPFAEVSLAVAIVGGDDGPAASDQARLAITFDHPGETYPAVERRIAVDVQNVFTEVSPAEGVSIIGPEGGPFSPQQLTYTIDNSAGDQQLFWMASAIPGDDPLFLQISEASGAIAPGASKDVSVTLDQAAVTGLDGDTTYENTLHFENEVTGAVANRLVSISVGAEPLNVPMVVVPAADVMTGGPYYDYRIGQYEITNEEFVAFLNDSLLRPTLPRNSYVHHVGAAGLVQSAEGGVVLFDAAVGGAISFDGNTYTISAGSETLPVVGVSWFGAVKFCNWLTLRQGMPAEQLVYHEGTSAEEWYPITIPDPTAWASRDLTAAEREQLLQRGGFRLPMDGGDQRDGPFNEWYKAAAWNERLHADLRDATIDGVAACDATGGVVDAWWLYLPSDDGAASARILGATDEFGISVHRSCAENALLDACETGDETLDFAVVGGQEYYVRVAGPSGDAAKTPVVVELTGPVCESAAFSPADDTCLHAPLICPQGVVTDFAYGFGRNTLVGADANYRNSGDPFDNGPTPVGFYNGINTLSAGGTTNSSSNAFGAYDLAGNVSEWCQDQGETPSERSTRGGHWQNVSSAAGLQNHVRGSDVATALRSFTGFRIAQSINTDDRLVVRDEGGIDVGSPLWFHGPIGGPFDVASAHSGYEIINPSSSTAIQYEICTDVSWLSINAKVGPTCVQGTLSPQEIRTLSVEPNGAAQTLQRMSYASHAMVDLDRRKLPANSLAYDVRVGEYEVTNSEFVEFLNDLAENIHGRAAEYLVIDEADGNVYTSPRRVGEYSPEGEADGLPLFSPAASDVSWNAAETQYEVDADRANHPATGMSWYGAVRFCDWLTEQEFGDPVAQLYTIGPRAADYRPAAIGAADWWGPGQSLDSPHPGALARDLHSTEREQFVLRSPGYRLAMDDGIPSAGDGLDEVSSYDEWFVAAAWDWRRGQPATFANTMDVLSAATMNLSGSGDPFETGSTPVAFFNGGVYNDGGTNVGDGQYFATRLARSVWGAFDMSGNVAEWVQDRSPDQQSHIIRGGSFRDDEAAPAIRTDVRTSMAPESCSDDIGFRLAVSRMDHLASISVRDLTHDIKVDLPVLLVLEKPLVVSPLRDEAVTGVWGSEALSASFAYTLQNLSESDSAWTASVDVPWLSVNGQSSISGDLGGQDDPVQLAVLINGDSTALTPGEHTGTLTVVSTATGATEQRSVRVSVDEPLDVGCLGGEYTTCAAPGALISADIVWLEHPPEEVRWTYLLRNTADTSIDYEVTVSEEWMQLDSADLSAGTLAASGDVGDEDRRFIDFVTSEQVTTLNIGEHDGSIEFRNMSTGTLVEAGVHVNIQDPLYVHNATALTFSGPAGGPFVPIETDLISFENRAGSYSIDYQISVAEDVDWLEWTDQNDVLTLLPRQSDAVQVNVGQAAASLAPGTYETVFDVENVTAGTTISVPVALRIGGNIDVEPAENFESAGIVGELPTPAEHDLKVRNLLESEEVAWRIGTLSASSAETSWLLIDGEPAPAVGQSTMEYTIAGGAQRDVVLSFSADALLTPGLRSISLGFVSGDDAESVIVRHVTLRTVAPRIAVLEMGPIANTSAQPDGPTYDYEMLSGPITNADFIEFLNDARSKPAQNEGRYLYFDTTTGSVYIQEQDTGGAGNLPDPSWPLVFAPGVGEQITFDSIDGIYELSPSEGSRTHAAYPVTGVSWFGALKFCNWLTLDQGMRSADRCYAEGPASDADAWRPRSIEADAWQSRDLNEAERQSLIEGCRGYRLPMDQGSNNSPVSGPDSADSYNEWYKAAAWNGVFNAVYGFGRNTLSGADANYSQSGDPFETDPVGTTPARFYDGSTYGAGEVGDGTPLSTNPTDNAYGLYDLSGNVFEWVQDKRSDNSTQRGLRGGSWSSFNPTDTLKNSFRISGDADLVNNAIGFRVVRVSDPPQSKARLKPARGRQASLTRKKRPVGKNDGESKH